LLPFLSRLDTRSSDLLLVKCASPSSAIGWKALGFVTEVILRHPSRFSLSRPFFLRKRFCPCSAGYHPHGMLFPPSPGPRSMDMLSVQTCLPIPCPSFDEAPYRALAALISYAAPRLINLLNRQASFYFLSPRWDSPP